MKLLLENTLLYIEPTQQKQAPVRDALTIGLENVFKVTAVIAEEQRKGDWDKLALKDAVFGITREDGTFDKKMGTRGWHTCECGATSGSYDFLLPNGLATNSLCVHYMEFHRNEVPQSEIDKVKNLLLLK